MPAVQEMKDKHKTNNEVNAHTDVKSSYRFWDVYGTFQVA